MSQPVRESEDDRFALMARDLLDIAGDRWSGLVVYALYERAMRFSELKARIDEAGARRLRLTGISHKMLTETLRGLQRNGLVAHVAAAGADPAAYALTPLGRSFWEPLMAVGRWTDAHLDEVEAARRSFDSEA